MARPRHPRPTPAELEILKILWTHGPLTVRETLERLTSGASSADRDERPGSTDDVATQRTEDVAETPRAYTSVMSLMNVMAEKGQLTRKLEGRAYRYAPADEPSSVRSDFLRDVWSRVFGESTESLALQLLDVSAPTEEELEAIRSAIDAYRASRGASPEQTTGRPSKSPNGRSRPRS